MHRVERGVARRVGERGATLLIALVLSVTFTLLALTLLASSDAALSVQANGAAIDRAERAAASGIEWAAATVLDTGLAVRRQTLALGSGDQVTVQIAPTASPPIVATGRCNGAEVVLAADVVVQPPAPLPYAFASFGGQQRFNHAVSVRGSSYLGHGTAPIDTGSTRPLQQDGDLFAVTATALGSGLLTQLSGAARYGQPALANPLIDATPYLTMTSGTVPVVKYVGSKTLKDTTIDGVVVVTLLTGQILTLQDMTLNGSLVVVTALDADLLRPTIAVKGNVTIRGGTATTGNLAILAPFIDLNLGSSINCTLGGVVVVKNCQQLKNLQVTGQLLTLGAIASTGGSGTFDRPSGFVPDVPLGVTWPGPSRLRIRWLGRQ